MSTNQTDLSGVYAMLEEIKSDIKDNGERPAATVDVEAVNNLAASMREAIEEARSPVMVEKRITINFAGSQTFIIAVAAVVVMIASFIIIPKMQKELSKRADNDLKYRYIQMRGSATSEDILMLREIFEFNRNTDSIRVIGKRVDRYERLIREQAEKAARASLTAEEAEVLKKEAERIRTGAR